MAEAENTAENLSTVLAELSIKTEKEIERVSILAGQLKKIFLSLIIAREREVTIILRIRYIICRLVTPRV